MSAPSISVVDSIKSPSEGKTTCPVKTKRERNMSLPCVNIVEAIKILATNNELSSVGKYKYLTSTVSETGSQTDSNTKATFPHRVADVCGAQSNEQQNV